jgi:tol-pal system protein YbgF
MIRQLLFLSAAAALVAAPAAHAEKKPEDPVEKRFQNLEKQLRQLREIVLQSKDTGQPVQVRVSTDPDPTLESLTQRMDDLEQAAKTRNDQIDTLTHDLEASKRANAASQTQIKALEERLAKAEGDLKTINDAAAAGASAAAGAPPVPGPPPPPGAALAPAPAPADPAAAGDAFKKAMQVLRSGDNTAGSAALQSFVETYGDSAYGPEARYWLGESLFVRGLYQESATAYIGAIRGWPQTPWAPNAVVKLARALIALNRPTDACHTLDELNRRYPSATPATKGSAQNARSAAKCAA